MANTKSAIKNIRKTETRTIHNRGIKSRLKTLQRRFRESLQGDDQEAQKTSAQALISAMDKAVKTNIIHENVARRQKSACSKVLFK